MILRMDGLGCSGFFAVGPLCPPDISPVQRGKPCRPSVSFTLTLASPIEGEGVRWLLGGGRVRV